MNPFTLIILNYRRRDNLMSILDAVEGQSERPQLFVWNNDDSQALRDDRIDWVINSPVNRFCWPRWWMAKCADTELVAVIDDDLCFTHARFFERLARYVRDLDSAVGIVGAEGVRLGSVPRYYPSGAGRIEVQTAPDRSDEPVHFAQPLADERVDIVKGRFMAMRASSLANLPAAPEFRDVCDDIAVSSYLGEDRERPHVIPSWLGSELENLPGKEGAMALSTNPGFRERREQAVRHYFFSAADQTS